MKPARTTLSINQCKAMMAQMSLRDKSLFAALLLCGANARTWTWQDAIDKSLDMPIALWMVLRGYATSRGLVISPLTESEIGKVTSLRVHWISGAVYDDAIWTAKSGVLLRMDPHTKDIIKTKNAHAQPYGTHEVTRRMKRYARLAGLNADQVSLRTVLNTHHVLADLYADEDKMAKAFGLTSETRVTAKADSRAVEWSSAGGQMTQKVRDPRLHGIGRRPPSSIFRVARKA